MNDRPYITDSMDGYLTDKAREAIKLLQDAGMDKDLAFAVLEELWDEEEIFALEDQDV